jgi:hypothetical protein
VRMDGDHRTGRCPSAGPSQSATALLLL